MTPARGELHVFADPGALAAGVAAWFADTASSTPGQVVVSLSGGSTPKRLYETLAAEPYRARLPWDRLVWTFGDERFVPPDDDASNCRMVRAALFGPAAVSDACIHPFRTIGVTPDASAAEYEAMLRGLAQGRDSLFDITLLGLGDDGHTASLIPGEPVTRERDRWVAAVPHGRENVRLSLTFPAIDASRHVAFLVTGGGKRDVLDRILSGDRTLPAGQVQPAGDLHWFVDREAAGRWAN